MVSYWYRRRARIGAAAPAFGYAAVTRVDVVGSAGL